MRSRESHVDCLFPCGDCMNQCLMRSCIADLIRYFSSSSLSSIRFSARRRHKSNRRCSHRQTSFTSINYLSHPCAHHYHHSSFSDHFIRCYLWKNKTKSQFMPNTARILRLITLTCEYTKMPHHQEVVLGTVSSWESEQRMNICSTGIQ